MKEFFTDLHIRTRAIWYAFSLLALSVVAANFGYGAPTAEHLATMPEIIWFLIMLASFVASLGLFVYAFANSDDQDTERLKDETQRLAAASRETEMLNRSAQSKEVEREKQHATRMAELTQIENKMIKRIAQIKDEEVAEIGLDPFDRSGRVEEAGSESE